MFANVRINVDLPRAVRAEQAEKPRLQIKIDIIHRVDIAKNAYGHSE